MTYLRVCLFVCVFVIGVYGQVGSLCRPNERLLQCGCPKTCKDPFPDCKGVCKEGCFCEEGEVRNATGNCVKLADCPRLANVLLDTSEPRNHLHSCSDLEEYRFCEPCLRTCETPNPICPAQCSRGCFCKGNLLRDKDGRCKPFHECSNFLEYIKERERNHVDPVPYRFTCGANQVYKECERCTRSCSDPAPVCGTKCKTGCFCQDGLVKGPDGKCVKIHECPRAVQTSFGSYPEVLDCSAGEEFFSCGWCEPSCRDLQPRCVAVCTRGCICTPPLVRHSSGKCVTKDQCETDSSSKRGLNRRCPKNEEYACRYGCEATCEHGACTSRPRRSRCILGCHCKLGLVRNANGLCVTEDQCKPVKQSDSRVNKVP